MGLLCWPETLVPTKKNYWPSNMEQIYCPKRPYQQTRITCPRIWGNYIGPKRRHQLTSFVEGEHPVPKKRFINFVQNLRTCLLANFWSSLRLFGIIFAHNILMFKSAVKNSPPTRVSLPFLTLSAIRNAWTTTHSHNSLPPHIPFQIFISFRRPCRVVSPTSRLAVENLLGQRHAPFIANLRTPNATKRTIRQGVSLTS